MSTKRKTKRKPKDKTPKKNGRPCTVTPEIVAKLESVFAYGGTVSMACSFAEITRDAFYRFHDKNEEFRNRIALLREKPLLKAIKTTVDSLSDPKWATWYLERKMKNEFSLRSEVTGANGEPFILEIWGGDAEKKKDEKNDDEDRDD